MPPKSKKADFIKVSVCLTRRTAVSANPFSSIRSSPPRRTTSAKC